MTSTTTSFFEFWRNRKEQAGVVQKTNQLRLLPLQQKRLLADGAVRAELQSTRMVSLLPPVGMEVFRRFTPASLEELQRRQEEKKKEVVDSHPPQPASDLEAGKPLPFIYGTPPPELLNTPLEELDPFYQSQKTFLVLDKGHVLHRFDAGLSCFLWSPLSPVRTVAIRTLLHSLFSVLVLLTLLTNCVLMVVSGLPSWTRYLDFFSVSVFMFEFIIKVLSRGVCVGHFSVLRDPWNWLDILVIVTAFLSLSVANLGKFTVVSLIPRILKLIPALPDLRKTVSLLVDSVKRLAGVLVLTGICLSVLALMSLQLLMGFLQNKCIIWPQPGNHSNVSSNYSKYGGKENFYFLPGNIDAVVCGNASDSAVCPEGYTCMKAGPDPNYGYTSFNSFGSSLLNMLRLLSRDFWSNLVLLVLRSAGKPYLTFFLLLVFPCCFFLLSLILAKVAAVIREWEEAMAADAKEKEQEFSQILEALRKTEKEEASRAALSQTQDDENKKSHDGRDRKCCGVVSGVSGVSGVLRRWTCCCGCWRGFVTDPFFDLGVVLCLILNTIFMSTVHFPMTLEFLEMFVTSELVFTGIFAAEMVLKLLAFGLHGYFQVGWHIYESIIVAISLVELTVDFPLHGLLLLRVFRLARWWPSFLVFLRTVWMSLRTLALLLVIVVFLFSVVGMQLFGEDYKDLTCRISVDCTLPRWHFTNFYNSFLVVFRVLWGEWVEVLWDCMEVSGQATCVIFYMMLVIIGNFLILNLFLTLLLSSYHDVLAAPAEKDGQNLKVAVSRIQRAFWVLLGKEDGNSAADSRGDQRKDYLALSLVVSDESVSEVKVPSNNGHDESLKVPEAEDHEEKDKQCDELQKHPEGQKKKKEEDEGNTPEDCCSDKSHRCCPFLDQDCGGGRVWCNFRRACIAVEQHRYFQMFMVLIILLSSAVLMFEDIYLSQHQTLQMVLVRADQVFTYLFVLEMLLRWASLGLRRYFTDAWCWLDFLILQASLVSLTADVMGFGPMRSLRVLMLLRLLSRSQGLRVVVQTLVWTAPPMMEALLVFLVLWLLFSVLGVSLFAGKFFHCVNVTSGARYLADQVNNRTECAMLIDMNYTEVRWENALFNFDNVMNGYLTLLVIRSSIIWDIWYSAADATQVESQPVYENQPFIVIFFICFIIVCFFIHNVFIRVLLDRLQTDKSGGKHLYMTSEQQVNLWAVKKRFFGKPEPPGPRPQNPCLAGLFDLVTHPAFEIFMLGLIFLSMLVLMVETWGDSIEKETVLHWLHLVFILVFLVEFVLKVTALRLHYFRNGLNVLDFVVLIGTIVAVFISDLMEKYFIGYFIISPFCIPVLRLARVGRVLHLTRFTRGIRKLLWGLMMSCPAVLNIGLLLFIVVFTYAVFGMFNFGHVRKTLPMDFVNFETFGNSLISVVVANNFDMMSVLMARPPDCDPAAEHPGLTASGDCGNPALAAVYFASFFLVSTLLLIHLFLAVVMATFNSDDPEPLSDADLKMFFKTWKKFDPDTTQFIRYSELSDFLDTLKDPLRIPKPNRIKLIHMDLPLAAGDKVHWTNIFLPLAAQVSGDSGQVGTLQTRLEEKFVTKSPQESREPISSTLKRKQEEVAAAVIQRAYRKSHLHPRDTCDDRDGASGV